MSATSEDYHSTIIFSRTDPSKLDKIALESHRVERVDINIKTPQEMAIKDAVSRLSGSERAVTCPIATINDLLIACKLEKVSKLKLDYKPSDLTSAEKALKEVISPTIKTNKYYIGVLEKAVDRLK